MKAIINWIILIPVLILAVGVELFTALNPEGAAGFFGMDPNGISEIIIIALIVLFAVFFLLSLFDRKTSPVHLLRRNYPAGICGVIAAFSLAGDTAAQVAEGVRGSGMGAMDVILVIVSAVAAVALLFAGINHCTGTNTKNSTAMLYLAVPLWCAVHLLSRFMTHTATPVAMSETLDLVMYVFMAIYFMYAMMVVSLINGKNPVKAAIYWGAPAAVASLVYTASVIGNTANAESASVFDYLEAVTCGFIGLYILSFVAELSFMSKTKDEQRVFAEEEEDTQPEQDTENTEDTEEAYVSVNVADDNSAADSSEPSDTIEDEINQNTRRFFNDISDVESEIEPEQDVAEELSAESAPVDPAKDYGNYFDLEESDDMYIESENIAVDTTKKHYVDKSKYPVTDEKTEQHYAVRDEYVVGIDQVGEDEAEVIPAAKSDKPAKAKVIDENSDNYEARLDEIDRLIISIQGGDEE